MHIMHAITTLIFNAGAGRPHHPSPVDMADVFVDPVRVRFEKDLPVARSPVLIQDEDQRMVTIHKAGQAQTPIRRRVKTTTVADGEDGSFVFVRRTPKRPMVLRSPPLVMHKRRVVEDEDEVSEEMKEEFAAWLSARVIAAKHSGGARRVWWC